mmetsp:Transcript_33656/g.56546  ORF Transcript_33656/g.56546 Transcript_33656/m.56546 type:complete len:91 (-) Transcript_33656:933-1205(-)
MSCGRFSDGSGPWDPSTDNDVFLLSIMRHDECLALLGRARGDGPISAPASFTGASLGLSFAQERVDLLVLVEGDSISSLSDEDPPEEEEA